MKATKFDERIENARNIFFDDEFFEENEFLSCREREYFLQNKESEKFSSKISTLETVLKQVFLFFPGTFILYILSAVFTVLEINIFLKPSGMTPRVDFFWTLLILIAAIPMTWIGLGNVRNLKHLVIPASIISVGVFCGVFATVLMALFGGFGISKFFDNLAFYIFPMALIVPFLAKGWIDRKSEN